MGEWKRWKKKPIEVMARQRREEFSVKTMEGIMKGKPGDFEVIGIRGERYPVDQDIFNQTYDPVLKNKLNPTGTPEELK